jgi:predicted O-methyltransferase YrrM
MTTLEAVRAYFELAPDQTRIPRRGRAGLAALFFELGFTRGVEIGCWEGEFAEILCQANPQLHLTTVDVWALYARMCANPHPERFELAERRAYGRLAAYPHCTLAHDWSDNVASTVPDGSLDFVYIDGDHTYSGVRADLQLWTPKVRSGGIVSGHDYRAFLPHEHELPVEVVRAVDTFMAGHGLGPLFVFDPIRRDRNPSWFWVQP